RRADGEGTRRPERPRPPRPPPARGHGHAGRRQALLTGPGEGVSGEPPGSPETPSPGPLTRTGGSAAGWRNAASRFALDVTPLRRSAAYRRLWFAQGVSFIGTEIAEVALAYQMYQLTGSTLAVGLISLTHLVPLLTLTVIGGAIADAFDRRRVMLVQQIGMVAGSLGLAANAALGEPHVWPLY